MKRNYKYKNYEFNEFNYSISKQFSNFVANYYEGEQQASFVIIRSFSCLIPRYDFYFIRSIRS